MSRFVPVTKQNQTQDKAWVNLDRAELLIPWEGGSRIHFNTKDFAEVEETPEELLNLGGA